MIPKRPKIVNLCVQMAAGHLCCRRPRPPGALGRRYREMANGGLRCRIFLTGSAPSWERSGGVEKGAPAGDGEWGIGAGLGTGGAGPRPLHVCRSSNDRIRQIAAADDVRQATKEAERASTREASLDDCTPAAKSSTSTQRKLLCPRGMSGKVGEAFACFYFTHRVE